MWKQVMDIWIDVIAILAFQEPSWKRAHRMWDGERKR
jgi:hypothetical protein